MEDFVKLKWRKEEYTRLFENHTHFIKEENITKSLVFSPTYFEDVEDAKYIRRKQIFEFKKNKLQNNESLKKKFKKKKAKNKKKLQAEANDTEQKVKPTNFNEDGYFPNINETTDLMSVDKLTISTDEPKSNNELINSESYPCYRPVLNKQMEKNFNNHENS